MVLLMTYSKNRPFFKKSPRMYKMFSECAPSFILCSSLGDARPTHLESGGSRVAGVGQDLHRLLEHDSERVSGSVAAEARVV